MKNKWEKMEREIQQQIDKEEGMAKSMIEVEPESSNENGEGKARVRVKMKA